MPNKPKPSTKTNGFYTTNKPILLLLLASVIVSAIVFIRAIPPKADVDTTATITNQSCDYADLDFYGDSGVEYNVRYFEGFNRGCDDAYTIGQKVPVAYNPGNPQTNIKVDPGSGKGAAVVVLVMGLFACGFYKLAINKINKGK